MKICRVIIILTLAVLLLVGCTPKENTPKDTEAMIEAENIYTQYMSGSNAQNAELMLCTTGGKFVLLRNGDAVGEYATKAEALTAAAGESGTAYAIFDCGAKNLYTCAPENRFMHVSFDDTLPSLQNLSNEKYNSLFDEPFYKWLKSLHDTYGAKFSLYVFTDGLENVTDRFAAEFAAASDWLKFGLHSPNKSTNYKNATYEEGKQAWNDFVANIIRITGTEDCIDRIPRLHNFEGSKNALLGMRDANCGAKGFLSTCNSAKSTYYLGPYLSKKLIEGDHMTDRQNGLVFLPSEWYVEQDEYYPKGVLDMLTNLYNDPANAARVSSCIMFTHEYAVYTAATETFRPKKDRVEIVCRFAFENNIPFAYPQEVTLSVTDIDT